MGILRLFLALSVVLAHSGGLFGFQLLGGQIAVEIFFIISGFYIAFILDKNYQFRLKNFYYNRFLRIVPLYLLVFIICLSVDFFLIQINLIPAFSPSFWRNWAEFSIIQKITILFSNLFIYGQDIFYFLNYTKLDGFYGSTSLNNPAYQFLFITTAWSLSLEEWYYMIIPLIYNFRKLLIYLFFGFLSIKFCTLYYDLSDPWSYRFVLSEFSLFIMGILMYRFGNKIPKIHISLSIILIICSVLVYNNLKNNIIYFLIVIINSISINSLFEKFRENKEDRIIGEYSYPLYLVHYPVIVILNYLNLDLFSLNKTVFSVCVIIFSFICANLLLKFQIPIERIRDRLRSEL
ncbi:MAG: acyltransferase [Deltaproteobacteria bacterium]|jgi:peptidoglycan/LPS O-acetylase OafA/YrhL|nr:acyltransferase [Deltaproteobacteria bacterium]